jgi:hypothetical protein
MRLICQLTKLILFSIITSSLSASAAELIYQEGFNNDGSAATPVRYTFVGRDVFEVPRIQSELNNYDQKGPIYWAHNFDASFVGNPNIPGRRAIFTWHSADAATGAATEDLLALWDSIVGWLTTNKANATIVVYPTASVIGELAARLTAKGHNVVDDDATILDEQDVPGDLFIHAGTANPSRFAMLTKPVIVMSEPDYDDMLVGSIGSLVTFDPGQVTVAAPTHPAAGGKTGSFNGFNLPAQPFGIVGSFLPPGATVLATVLRTIPPAINNLADVDAVIAGSKQNSSTPGTATEIDFGDGSAGTWTAAENASPGGYAGNWGLRVAGTLNISAAGTYRFALGSDDGARLYIDLDKNGVTAADILLEDAGPHAHQVVYQDATFAAAGTYPFEVRSYNSGGGGSLELTASIQAVPIPDDALDSGYWEVLSTSGSGPVTLQAAATVTAYIATGANVQVQTPLAVLLNGPNDTPPGSFYDGGPFTGFEGAGFIGASGLNKWPYPAETGTYRSLQLRPVNVTGKTNVQLTIKLAGTGVDFETTDFLDIVVYPQGITGTNVTLAHFRGVANAVQPWMADELENYVRRLTKEFKDFTYNVPANATDLVVEIRAATSWWTEIAAFDDIRITAGSTGGGGGDPTISIAKNGANAVVTFANGTLQRSATLGSTAQWTDVTATGTHTVPPAEQGAAAFFRVIRR